MLIEGFVEAISDYQIRGWAYDPLVARRRVQLVATLAGSDFITGIADVFRDDLLGAGIGDGRHGFVLNFDKQLLRSEQDLVSLFIQSDDGVRKLIARLSDPVARNETQASISESLLAPVDLESQPLFILGAARSGTSAVAQSLLKSGAFLGHEEGHCLPLLARHIETINTYFANNAEEADRGRATTLSSISREYFFAAARGTFVDLYRRLYGQRRWLDKTPKVDMILLAPILVEIWPKANFIFVKRRGLENIVSRMKKFPQISFEKHCSDWALVMNQWVHISKVLHPKSFLVVDNYDMMFKAYMVAAEIAEHLSLNPEEGAGICLSLTHDRPERTTESWSQPVCIDQLNWSPSQKLMFRSICGSMMKHWNYTEDNTYRHDGHH